jgi:hypothetical protein
MFVARHWVDLQDGVNEQGCEIDMKQQQATITFCVTHMNISPGYVYSVYMLTASYCLCVHTANVIHTRLDSPNLDLIVVLKRLIGMIRSASEQ